MSVTVQVSPQLASVTGKDEIVLQTKPHTVGDALDALEAKHPGVRARLMTKGSLREWVKVYVGEQEIFEHLGGLETHLRDGAKIRIVVPGKARVHFAQENRTVEVEPGRTIKDIALEAGIDPNRKYQNFLSCEGLGLFDGCKCWVKPGRADAVNGQSWTERALHDLKGWQRLACQTRVYADVEVWTMPQGDERLREPRPIAPPPPQPKKRERFLESIFRSPAPDDEEGDAETKPAAKKSPTDTKAKVPAGAAPGSVAVDVAAVAEKLAVPAIPDAVDAAVGEQKKELKSERPAAKMAEPGPSEPKPGALDAGGKNEQMPPALDPARPETARVEATAAKEGVATPIVTPVVTPIVEPPAAPVAAPSVRPAVPRSGPPPAVTPTNVVDPPKALADAMPTEGARTALAESTEGAQPSASARPPAAPASPAEITAPPRTSERAPKPSDEGGDPPAG